MCRVNAKCPSVLISGSKCLEPLLEQHPALLVHHSLGYKCRTRLSASCKSRKLSSPYYGLRTSHDKQKVSERTNEHLLPNVEINSGQPTSWRRRDDFLELFSTLLSSINKNSEMASSLTENISRGSAQVYKRKRRRIMRNTANHKGDSQGPDKKHRSTMVDDTGFSTINADNHFTDSTSEVDRTKESATLKEKSSRRELEKNAVEKYGHNSLNQMEAKKQARRRRPKKKVSDKDAHNSMNQTVASLEVSIIPNNSISCESHFQNAKSEDGNPAREHPKRRNRFRRSRSKKKAGKGDESHGTDQTNRDSDVLQSRIDPKEVEILSRRKRRRQRQALKKVNIIDALQGINLKESSANLNFSDGKSGQLELSQLERKALFESSMLKPSGPSEKDDFTVSLSPCLFDAQQNLNKGSGDAFTTLDMSNEIHGRVNGNWNNDKEHSEKKVETSKSVCQKEDSKCHGSKGKPSVRPAPSSDEKLVSLEQVEELFVSASCTTDANKQASVEICTNGCDFLKTSPGRVVVACRRKKLLILDINGLLADVVMPPPKGFRANTNILRRAIFKRPFCDDFLKFCFERFDVGIWSSRSRKIVDKVVDYLLGDLKHRLLFCWDVSHATQSGFKTLENRFKPLVCKELRKIWEKCDPNLPWEKGDYDESNTLLLDDSPYKALLNPMHTAIFPTSYTFLDKGDNALAPGGSLRVYLENLSLADNVQHYVQHHPFGQSAIDETNTSWSSFYSRVLCTMSSQTVSGELHTVC